MLSTPDVRVTKSPGYVTSDPSTGPKDQITLESIDSVPELRVPMHALHRDYLELVDMLCTPPLSHELGKRRIRRAVAAAVQGWSPAEYAALSEDRKDAIVEKVLGDRQPNDGQWPSLLFYIGDRMAGTLGMSPSVRGEMKLGELVADDLINISEPWSQCWNDDSLRWPTSFAWITRHPSPHTGYLYLCGGYAVHLAKHRTHLQDPIRRHAHVAMLHELVHDLRSFLRGRNSNNCTPEKCVDSLNAPDAGSGIGEGGRCFEQLAFGCVVELYSGNSRSCLLARDYDAQNQPVYEIPNELSKYLLHLTHEHPPIVLPSQGGPAMPLFQYSPPSSFPLVKYKPSFKFSTTNTTIPVSPPRTPSLQSPATPNGLIPVTGEFLEHVQAFYKRREGFHCVQRSRR